VALLTAHIVSFARTTSGTKICRWLLPRDARSRSGVQQAWLFHVCGRRWGIRLSEGRSGPGPASGIEEPLRDPDKGRYLSIPGARSGNSLRKLGPSIVIVEIRDHIVIRIVICIESDRIFKTWPPIYRGQKRPVRDRLRLSQLSTSLFSTRTKFRLVCLNLYLWVHPTPSSPDHKSFI
jgi:hypothetical protein